MALAESITGPETAPKVAYLLGRYPTVSHTFVYREIAHLLASSWAVGVYGLSRTKDSDHKILSPKRIGWVPTASMVHRVDKISAALTDAWLEHGGRPKDLRRAAWLARRWREDGIDVVHVHFLGFSAALAAVACAVAGIPLVVTVHARGILVPDALAHFSLARATGLISISQHTRGLVLAISGRPSNVVPVAVTLHPAVKGWTGPLHVLTVARPVPKKGYPVLRKAIAALGGDVLWTVMGAEREEIGGPMVGLKALGKVAFEQVEACYAAGVDVFALACQTGPDGDEDGIPVAILEAMARGVPVVTTAAGGIAELINDGENGLLVPASDPVAMADAIQRLSDDPKLRARLGRAGRQTVLNHRQPERQVAALKACLGAAMGASA